MLERFYHLEWIIREKLLSTEALHNMEARLGRALDGNIRHVLVGVGAGGTDGETLPGGGRLSQPEVAQGQPQVTRGQPVVTERQPEVTWVQVEETIHQYTQLHYTPYLITTTHTTNNSN